MFFVVEKFRINTVLLPDISRIEYRNTDTSRGRNLKRKRLINRQSPTIFTIQINNILQKPKKDTF